MHPHRLIAALLLLFAVPITAQEMLAPAEIDRQALYIPFPVAITLDGETTDWEGVPAATVDDGPAPARNPAENGSFTLSVAADTENLYVLMTMPDQNIITGQHGSNYWNEDSLEFYVNLTDNRYTTSYSEGIFQININPGDIGNTDPAALTLTGRNSSFSNLQGFVFATDDGWGFEAALPISDYLTPAHGLEIGFQAHANGATERDRDVKLIWSAADTNDSSFQNPSLFGSGLFYEIGQEDVPLPSEPPEPIEIVEEPTISVNQVGYFANAPKFAMFSDDTTARTAWVLFDAETDEQLTGGLTSAGVADAASGDLIKTVDFSSVTTPGRYVLQIDNIRSAPFVIADDLYADLKIDALKYFYHNRSGIPIEEPYVEAQWTRPAGHLTDDNVTCYRGTAMDGVVHEGCDYTLNARGGWYDAGDHGKYVVNGGISVWTLLNLYETLPDAIGDGDLNIPESGNGVSDLLDEVRWQMEFMLSMQVPAGQPLAGMVHHKLHDLQWEPIPYAPPTEVDNDNDHTNDNIGRYVYKPTTAATLNLAATAAQCARIWRGIDDAFAQRCLGAAVTAWEAANDHPEEYIGNTPGSGGGNYSFEEDGSIEDEFFWAAAELFITSNGLPYLEFMRQSPYFAAGDFPFTGLQDGILSPMNWGRVDVLGTLSLLSAPNLLTESDRLRLESLVIATANRYVFQIMNEGYRVPLSVDGYTWGSNSLVLNNAIVMAHAHRLTGETRYLHAVMESMDYLLGRNALSFSFVSGYGANAMTNPHHRFWANQDFAGFPPPPPGVIAGGPNNGLNDPYAAAALSEAPPAKRYLDNIEAFSTNEVTINWNAPLAWVVTYLDKTIRGAASQ